MNNSAVAFLALLPDGWYIDLPGECSKTLLAIAAHSQDGQTAAVSASQLASHLGGAVTARTVQRHIDALESRRLLQHTTGAAFNAPNTYTVTRSARTRATSPVVVRGGARADARGGGREKGGPADDAPGPDADAHPPKVREYMLRQGGRSGVNAATTRRTHGRHAAATPPLTPPIGARSQDSDSTTPEPPHHHHAGGNASTNVDASKRGGGGDAREGETEAESAWWHFTHMVANGFSASEARKLIKRHGHEQVERNVRYWQRKRDAGARLGPGALHKYIENDDAGAVAAADAKRAEARRAKTAAVAARHDATAVDAARSVALLDAARSIEERNAATRAALDRLSTAEFEALCESIIGGASTPFKRGLLKRHRAEARTYAGWLSAFRDAWGWPETTNPQSAASGESPAPTSAISET